MLLDYAFANTMKRFLILFLVFFVQLPSCIKDDITNIEAGKIVFSPEYAVPIGSYEFKVSNYVDGVENFNPIDTSGFAFDSLLKYNDEFYSNPYTAYYSTTEPFTIGNNQSTLSLFKSAMFRINSVNKIPATITIQIYFLNEAQLALDSLFKLSPLTIPVAETNESGSIINNGELWKQDTYLDSNEIKVLNSVNYLQISSIIEFPEPVNTLIPFDSTQTIWLQLGIKFNLSTIF